jgi:methyl-accepting chemotaxis protein
MSKEQTKDIASLVGTGSNVSLVAIALLAWNTFTNLEKKLDAHMSDTSRLMREQAEIIREIRQDVERLKKATGLHTGRFE